METLSPQGTFLAACKSNLSFVLLSTSVYSLQRQYSRQHQPPHLRPIPKWLKQEYCSKEKSASSIYKKHQNTNHSREVVLIRSLLNEQKGRGHAHDYGETYSFSNPRNETSQYKTRSTTNAMLTVKGGENSEGGKANSTAVR
jgi:hypothetical protein